MDRLPLTREDLDKLGVGTPLWLTKRAGSDDGNVMYVAIAHNPGSITIALCREDPMIITCENPDFIDPDDGRLFMATTDQIPTMADYYRAIRRFRQQTDEELNIIDLFDPEKFKNNERKLNMTPPEMIYERAHRLPRPQSHN